MLIYPQLSPLPVYLKSGRNFCPNPVNPVPAGFENSKSGAPLIYLIMGLTTQIYKHENPYKSVCVKCHTTRPLRN
jgi:hypothetical protein